MSHYSNLTSDFFFTSNCVLNSDFEVNVFSQLEPEQCEKNEFSKSHPYFLRSQNSRNSNNINNNSNFTIYPFIDCNNAISLRKDFSFSSEIEKSSKFLNLTSAGNNNSNIFKNKQLIQNENKDYKVVKISEINTVKNTNFSFIQNENLFINLKEKLLKRRNKTEKKTLRLFTENLTYNYIVNKETVPQCNASTKRVEFVKCKCQKSKCLKNYCDCFAKGQLCKEGCQCVDCSNNQASLEQIKKAKQLLYIKNKKSLSKQSEIVCKCSKSHCQKKYCECYTKGRACNAKCKCVECKNVEHNETICNLSKQLNEKNYTNHKRERSEKNIKKKKFVIDKNIVHMINKFKILKSTKSNQAVSISTNSETNQYIN